MNEDVYRTIRLSELDCRVMVRGRLEETVNILFFGIVWTADRLSDSRHSSDSPRCIVNRQSPSRRNGDRPTRVVYVNGRRGCKVLRGLETRSLSSRCCCTQYDRLLA